ncbi:peptidase inhibitor family I36 protein [Allokutzneria sp. NRRL B-24872]|uniref:peptidase inhibitor family I36 protein n=1 Tax=Allokutzneria sp. NRRL B-24872 TaxID=1137961 RepID=UPI000A3A8CA3|nr:peptidase inhibitor family I36 protein [Allokutzneria sp. NRRL B-24872]
MFKSITAAASVAVSVAVLGAPVANAGDGTCREGYVCMWEHANYSGRLLVENFPRLGNNEGHPMPEGTFDKVSSVVNSTDCRVELSGAGLSSRTHVTWPLSPRSRHTDLTAIGANDRARSYFFVCGVWLP